jgi:hypothetical protein
VDLMRKPPPRLRQPRVIENLLSVLRKHAVKTAGVV